MQALAGALGGAGLAVLATGGWSWSVLAGALIGAGAARFEARFWTGRGAATGLWLTLGWAAFGLLLAAPLLGGVQPPDWRFQDGLQEVVRRHASGVLLLAALVLAVGARAWGAWRPAGEGPEASGRRWTLWGISACIALFAAMACLACWSFHKYVDLANDNELMLRLSRGEGPRCYLPSIYPSYPDSCIYWAQHFTLLWALVAPLYALWPGPYFLLVLQAVLVPLAALPIYLALKDRLGPRQAAGLALAYLLYPTTQHALLHEVHGLSMAVPFTAGLWWALGARRWGWAAAFTLLALTCREEIAFILAGIGLAWMLERGRWVWGLVLLVASAAWFLYLTNHLMPSLGGDRDWRTYKFASLGGSHPEILKTLLTRPLFVLSLYLQPAKLANLAIYLLPLAGLPVLGWRTALVAAPLFLSIFLSDSAPAYSYLLFYVFPAVPFLFFGAGEGLLALERRGGRRLRDAAWAALMAGSFAATVIFGASPLSLTFWDRGYVLGSFAEPYHHASVYVPTEHATKGHRILARLPDEATVAAQAFFLPHLARVKRMRNLPDVATADYVLLDVSHPNRYELRVPGEYEAFVASLRADSAWKVVLDEDGYLLFARETAPPLLP